MTENNQEYTVEEMAEVIRDLTLRRAPRHPADTPAKQAYIVKMQKDIDEATEKGYTIFVPDPF